MDPLLITSLLTEINHGIGHPQPTREPIRVWSMSGVERLTYPDGTTAIFKYATEPFTREDQHVPPRGTASRYRTSSARPSVTASSPW